MSTPDALPEAPPALREEILDWLDRFAACVRAVDYRSAYAFWHPQVLAFGTHQRVLQGLWDWRDRQWDSVWPRTSDFRFLPEETRVLQSPDGAMVVAIAPWTSTGYHADGTPFDRPGRATIVLMRDATGRWRGVHSHMSLERGVPQESFGNRPVLAR
ncbi:MAG: nuclear transport factor 2 family protein [Rhodovarius sp.]|nr:nuclear transport factor 2 family protein [Rhodovarius sp.]MDW8315190.1 nuclear transport factor 2 family protein [Rhodovarius sp.]